MQGEQGLCWVRQRTASPSRAANDDAPAITQ